jgi:hypothetical protein
MSKAAVGRVPSPLDEKPDKLKGNFIGKFDQKIYQILNYDPRILFSN